MKRRTPLMLRSRIARSAMEYLKMRQWSSAARRPGLGRHAKSAVMFRSGSDGKKKVADGLIADLVRIKCNAGLQSLITEGGGCWGGLL